jgi:GTP cyclohydrolase I
MMMRGVEKQNTQVTTSSLLGKFRQDQRSRAEFLNLVQVDTR